MYFALVIYLLTVCQPGSSPADTSQTIAFTGAQVWSGEKFIERSLYIRDDQLIEKPTKVDSTVNLEGKYVVPPYGDAHTHSLGVGGASKEIAAEQFMNNGIFYAADLTNPYSEIRQIEEWFEQPSTVDVAFANGGLTSTGVHPTGAMERIFTDNEKITLDNLELENDAYWFMDTLADVKKKWPKYIKQDPDIVKVYLTYVAEGSKEDLCNGLCPTVLDTVVSLAHQQGKQVFAHVSTASDVKFALDAGVDAIAHLPSGNDGITINEEEFWLSDKTIQRAGQDSVILTPTASLLVEDANPDTLKKEIARQRKQLQDLRKVGVQIALGADEWKLTALYEARYLYKHEMFSNSVLLNILTKNTPQAIFPDRNIGLLSKGYEASFLVLNCNPVKKFKCIENIKMGIKQGKTVIK